MLAPTMYMPFRSELVVKDVFEKFNTSGNWWSIYHDISIKYSTPRRFYHTAIGHMESCLAEFWHVKKYANNPTAVAMALVLHDVIMDFQRNDNEEKSAEYAREVLKRMNAPLEFANEVAELIMATKHDAIPQSEDAKLVVDIDLSILGKNSVQFAVYECRIRKEYAFVPEKIFRERRAEILQKFLDRPSIFLTEYFRKKYEIRARKNIEESIMELSKEV